METYLGLDLGGTKLLIGEVDPYGNILRYKRYDSGFFNQKAAFDIIKQSLDDYVATVGWVGKKPVSMGVGLIGRVDPNKGIWLQIDPHRTETIALAEELSARYGIPCRKDQNGHCQTCLNPKTKQHCRCPRPPFPYPEQRGKLQFPVIQNGNPETGCRPGQYDRRLRGKSTRPGRHRV